MIELKEKRFRVVSQSTPSPENTPQEHDAVLFRKAQVQSRTLRMQKALFKALVIQVHTPNLRWDSDKNIGQERACKPKKLC